MNTITWKRKGPKGCYRTVHEGRIVLLERIRPPADRFWFLHQPDGQGGIVSDTLYGPTNELAFKTATALLRGEEVPDMNPIR